MWSRLQTLRVKLTILNLLVFGVIVTTLCIAILQFRQADLRREFDQRLSDRAESMAGELVVAAVHQNARHPSTAESPVLNRFHFPGYYIQVRLADGSISERSRNLADHTLPLTDAGRAAKDTGDPVIETLQGDVLRGISGDPDDLRLLTLYHDRPGTSPFYLQVALSLASVNQAIANLHRLFFTAIPIGLLTVAIASWLLARRSLAPIGRIARRARQLSAADLSHRIEQPRGGDEVAALVTTINQMLDRLSAAFGAQERFIANASHELKTPLSVLLGQAQVLMQRNRPTEEYQKFVTSVQEEVRSLSQTVDSLLMLARAEAGLTTLSASDVSLNEAVMDAVQRCEPSARNRRVRLVPILALPGGEEPEPLVSGDGELLRLMFVNLIQNAIRFSPLEGTVETEVTVSATEAAVSVRDHGPGIPPEYLDRVFDRFFRVPNTETVGPGIGVGLTIVQGVARTHGGTVSAANRSGGGCEFLVCLPLEQGRERVPD